MNPSQVRNLTDANLRQTIEADSMMAEISPCNPGCVVIHGPEQTRYMRMDIILDDEAWQKLKKYIERFDGDTFGSLAEAVVRGINILDAQRSMDEYGDAQDRPRFTTEARE